MAVGSHIYLAFLAAVVVVGALAGLDEVGAADAIVNIPNNLILPFLHLLFIRYSAVTLVSGIHKRILSKYVLWQIENFSDIVCGAFGGFIVLLPPLSYPDPPLRINKFHFPKFTLRCLADQSPLIINF